MREETLFDAAGTAIELIIGRLYAVGVKHRFSYLTIRQKSEGRKYKMDNRL